MSLHKMPRSPNQEVAYLTEQAKRIVDDQLKGSSTLTQLIDQWNATQRLTPTPMGAEHPLWKRIEYEMDRRGRVTQIAEKESMVSSTFISRKPVAILTSNGELVKGQYYKYVDTRLNKIVLDAAIMGESGHYYDEIYDDWLGSRYFKDITDQITILGEI